MIPNYILYQKVGVTQITLRQLFLSKGNKHRTSSHTETPTVSWSESRRPRRGGFTRPELDGIPSAGATRESPMFIWISGLRVIVANSPIIFAKALPNFMVDPVPRTSVARKTFSSKCLIYLFQRAFFPVALSTPYLNSTNHSSFKSYKKKWSSSYGNHQ